MLLAFWSLSAAPRKLEAAKCPLSSLSTHKWTIFLRKSFQALCKPEFPPTLCSGLHSKAGDQTQLTSFHFISSWKLTTILTCLPPSLRAEPSPGSSKSMSEDSKHQGPHSCSSLTMGTTLVYSSQTARLGFPCPEVKHNSQADWLPRHISLSEREGHWKLWASYSVFSFLWYSPWQMCTIKWL